MASVPARLPQPLPHGIPLLRWTYRREGELVYCELALTRDLSAYELRITPPRFLVGPPSELFDDAASAFHRQAQVAHALVDEGWHLDSFENDRLL